MKIRTDRRRFEYDSGTGCIGFADVSADFDPLHHGSAGVATDEVVSVPGERADIQPDAGVAFHVVLDDDPGSTRDAVAQIGFGYVATNGG